MDWYAKCRYKYGKPTIWIHPITGEYRIPAADGAPMPERYKRQGFVVKEFSSFYEHRDWCKKMGLVNHFVEGIKDDGDALGKNKWGY